VRISEDNPHQTPNPHLFLKICLVLEYWTGLIPVYNHFSPNLSVFFLNTLSLSSGFLLGFCGDLVEIGISPNTLEDYSY
jgi:hypothetical protein